MGHATFLFLELEGRSRGGGRGFGTFGDRDTFIYSVIQISIPPDSLESLRYCTQIKGAGGCTLKETNDANDSGNETC